MKTVSSVPSAQHRDLLVSAHSNNSAAVWRICADADSAANDCLLQHSADLLPPPAAAVEAAEAIFLSVDVPNAAPDRAFFSTSAGELCAFDLRTQQQTDRFQAHSLEAWTCAAQTNSSVVFTGADDALIKGWDLGCRSPAHTIKWYVALSFPVRGFYFGRHSAGVCALQMHPSDPWLFASGSYDGTFALWDRRSLARPVGSSETGGGVWRIRWSSAADCSASSQQTESMTIWTACMYNGFHAFHIAAHKDIASSDSVCLPEFTAATEAVAYGLSLQEKSGLLGTCTFYDGIFRLWRK